MTFGLCLWDSAVSESFSVFLIGLLLNTFTFSFSPNHLSVMPKSKTAEGGGRRLHCVAHGRKCKHAQGCDTPRPHELQDKLVGPTAQQEFLNGSKLQLTGGGQSESGLRLQAKTVSLVTAA